MKQLFEHIKKSIYGPEYYHELLTRPFKFSWKYYSALALVVALFLTIVSSISLVPRVLDATREFPTAFFAYYPDQLEVKIDKGIASSNVTEPYFLPTPEVFTNAASGENKSQSLVVIDTKTPFSLEQFNAHKADIWFGGKQVAVTDNNGGVRIAPFTEKTNFTINEGVLRSFEQKLQPFYKFVAPAVVLVIFLGLLISFAMNLGYLLFGAALIFFLGRLLKQYWSYGASYRIGLHAITLPLLLNTLLLPLSIRPLHFPFLFSAMMLAIVYLNFKGIASGTTPLTPTTLSELASLSTAPAAEKSRQ